MAQVDFNYESKKTTIQCNPDDTMESIINKLLKKIDNYKVMSLFCINVLTCCMSNKYKSSIPTDLSTKYSSFIQKANYQIDNYGKKVNKLKFLFPFLEINDKSIEYLTQL